MASNQPLFSRRQLNLIIAVTAVVIALLSIPTQSWPTIERQQLQQVSLSFIDDSDQSLQLRLLFALPQPGLLPQPSAKLLIQLLAPRLATESIQPTLHGDRISLSIRANSPEQLAQQLQRLPPLLRQPFEPAAIDRIIKQQRAQRHLNRNKPQPLRQADRWLRQQQSEPMSAAATTQLQQQLFSQAQLRISLTGSTVEKIKAALNALLQQLPAGQLWPAIQAQAQAQASKNTINPTDAIKASDIRAKTTALQSLPGRQSDLFPQTLLLSRITALLTDIPFRFYPAATASWLIGVAPATNTDPNWLKAELTQALQRLAAMQDWELEHAADDVRDQLEQRLRQPDAVPDQLEVIAFYQLPVDYLPQFDATIAALTGAQIRQQLLEALQPERFDYTVRSR